MDKPLLVVIDGRDKPFRTVLADRDYRAVRVPARSISRELGDRYRFLLHITNKIFPAIDK